MNRRQFSKGMLLVAGASAIKPLQTFAQLGQPKLPAQNLDTTLKIARGVVSHSKTREGVANVRVSNGRDVVKTDRRGRYELPISDGDIVFVVKPSGFTLNLDSRNMPQFYRIHSPGGSPKQEFVGIAPTGSLPTSIDFVLTPQQEADEFRVLVFGDPQSRNQAEVDYLTRDILEDLVGVKAAFGISLGDIAFDDLSIYENQNRAVAQLGLPWFNLMGNHDINFDSVDRVLSAETYKATFGPTYYSFDYGSAHFVVLDDVAYDGIGSAAEGKKKGTYHTELGEKQLRWLENDLKFVPNDQLVVLLMHIPVVALEGDGSATMKDSKQFFALLENRPHTLSISAHTHFQEHRFIGKEAGWNGAQPHHHFNCVTTCGSWWRGAPDERGIPHTTMRDGAPNGYAFLNIKGSSYTIDFRGAGHVPTHQISLYAPDEIKKGEPAELLANVFNGSPRSKVEMKVAGGTWLPMAQVEKPDPGYAALKANEEKLGNGKVPGRPLPEIIDSAHLWAAPLPQLAAGVHLVTVRETDMWNRTTETRRMVRVA